VIWLALAAAAGTLVVAAIVLRVGGHITRRTFYALGSLASGTNLIVAAAHTDYIGGPINAAAFAVSAWLWWHDGGDDTKRRLRVWATRSRGTRRTGSTS
jgi:hypothetical protein